MPSQSYGINKIIDETILFWKIDPDISDIYGLHGLKIKDVSPLVRTYIYLVLQDSMPMCQESRLARDWSQVNIYDQIVYLEELANEIEKDQYRLIKFKLFKKFNSYRHLITVIVYQILLDHLLLLIRDLESINN